jgi:hypothetical protein
MPATSIAVTYNERPWWTERSAFVEGDTLYAVGVASSAKSVEDGRQQAFERGRLELGNYAQITSLEAQGLVIETQMTFEEPNQDGTVTVYRLLRVPVSKLLSVQSQLQGQSRFREQELDRGRKELEIRRATLRQKEQEAESLLQQLKGQLGEQQTKPGDNDSNTPIVDQLKQVSVQVDKQAKDAEAVIQSAQQRIARGNEARKAMCSRLLKGMTKAEVSAVIGEPTGIEYSTFFYYGPEKRISIAFDKNTGEAQGIQGCDMMELGDEQAKRWRELRELREKLDREREKAWVSAEREASQAQNKQKPKAAESRVKREQKSSEP